MKTKILFILLGAVSAIIPLCAQTTQPVYYTYDDCGNRTLRSITMPLNKSAEVKDSTSSEYSSQDKKNTQPEKYKDKISQKDIVIYPNPTKGLITVEVIGYDTKDGLFQVELYDLAGHKLQTGRLNYSTGEINISDFKAGMYIMRISIGSDMRQWTIVKE